ncbi:hypothetical protein [Aeromonas phage AS-szw]|uniref:GatB/YqeY domain-containing protein n=1 Tax=Aeromonas phage AS-szw TaxID=2026114 RepID=A0A291LE88_9CAUD|nr:hypothetical protein [Aeromonas phage AS-szw]
MLLEKIKKDQISFRKSEDRSTHCGKVRINALTTLIGEASPSGNQVVTDEQVQSVIRKFVKNIDEAVTEIRKRVVSVSNDMTNQEVMDILKTDIKFTDLMIERELLSSYLPKVFDEEHIKEVLGQLVGGSNIGQVMGACKKAAADKGLLFDGALVKKVLG